MVQNIFIGVDGGGTKTKLFLEDEKGVLLAHAKGGPANIRLSVDQSWQSINQALEQALQEAQIELDDPNYRFHLGLGLAGTEIASAVEEFLKRPHPFATIKLRSDAYVACLGAHGGADGAIIIIGTGVVGYQIEGQKHSQVNGWGFPHGDEGGGAWLGLEAVRKTLQWLDGREEKTSLLEAVFNHFQNDFSKLVLWANQTNSSGFASIAPLVVKYVQEKDPHALALIKKAALEIEKVAAALDKKRVNKNIILPCSFFGGIALFIEPWVEVNLKNRLVPRKFDATEGAIIMIRQEVENKIRGKHNG